MKIAITDYTFPDLAIEQSLLEPLGCEIVAWKEKRSSPVLRELVADADAVITQFAPVTAEVIGSMQRAKAIVRYGIGVDNVDLEAARERGIPVCNVPDYCIDEVADHTLAFLLATTRQVLPNALRVREGGWGLATPLDQMRTLRDLTVGIVGFGRIGREVAARLLAFKCKVLVHDPVIPASAIADSGCQPVALSDLFAQADVITLHCPSTAQTRGMLDAAALAKMKRGAIVINVARGDLIDSAALTAALQSGHISAAALDVFAPEPIPLEHPIRKMDNVIIASHIASASVPASRKLRETAAKLAAMAVRGEPLPNVVNGVERANLA
jgi:D-3-phosphoglycerate dehydrogenase